MIKHIITKKIDASEKLRYFFLYQPEKEKFKNPFKSVKINLQFNILVDDTNYQVMAFVDKSKGAQYIYVDVPNPKRPKKISYFRFNDKGDPISPEMNLEVSIDFEDIHEQTLTIFGSDDKEAETKPM